MAMLVPLAVDFEFQFLFLRKRIGFPTNKDQFFFCAKGLMCYLIFQLAHQLVFPKGCGELAHDPRRRVLVVGKQGMRCGQFVDLEEHIEELADTVGLQHDCRPLDLLRGARFEIGQQLNLHPNKCLIHSLQVPDIKEKEEAFMRVVVGTKGLRVKIKLFLGDWRAPEGKVGYMAKKQRC